MDTVKDILKEKGFDVWRVKPDASIDDALKLMAEKNVGAVLVMRDGAITGIFSERDFARKIFRFEKSLKEIKVEDLMTRPVLTVTPQTTVDDCVALMTHHRFRHLPVVEDGVVTGIVSIGDVVKTIISHQQFTINELGKYISGA
ncbi:MAG: CBS domain-containing protein [Candidatus Omnitrophica bacterium]|nr:CBS domain-containing protein [Candidatus Omnitrophota bacterium]